MSLKIYDPTTGQTSLSQNVPTQLALRPQTGSIYGGNTSDNQDIFLMIFQAAATKPAIPSGGIFNWDSATLTPPSGWSASPLNSVSLPIWISVAYISKTQGVYVWSDPAQFFNPNASGLTLQVDGVPVPPTNNIINFVDSTAQLNRINFSFVGNQIQAQGDVFSPWFCEDITIANDDASGSIALAFPDNSTTDYAIFFPPNQGAANTYLRNDGTGILSWVPETGTGTVTNVSSALTGLTFTNPTTTPQLTAQNVGATPTTVFLRGDGTWQVVTSNPGTVTSIGFSAPASSAFAVTNPTSNALIGFQNVGATPTTVFLRGDGTWAAPTFSTSLQLLNNANNVINNSGANIGITQWQNVSTGVSTFISGDRVRTTTLYLEGTSSGTVIFNTAAVTNAYTLTWPTAQGGTGQTLINNGAGVLSWGNAGGAQFLYQLEDVDLNENNRTQISLIGSTTPIDEVQPTILNIQPGITVSGLAAGDYIAPSQTFAETVRITSISAGGAGSTNINVDGGATIWIGTGTFTSPQYQEIWKVTNNIAVGDALRWTGSIWTNQPVSGGSGGVLAGPANPTATPASIPSLFIQTTDNSLWEYGSNAWVSLDTRINSQIIAGTGITKTLSLDGRSITLDAAGGGGVLAPFVGFTGSATGGAGQVFTNANLAVYNSVANAATVLVNGVGLSPTNYSLTTNTLTILDYLLPNVPIQVIAKSASSASGTSQSFAYRDDVPYLCVDNNNNSFIGIPQQGQQATATITFASAVPANSALGNTVITFTSAVPGLFVDGTSILVFSSTGLFNVTLAVLDVAAGPVYQIAGEINAAPGTSIPAGTYTITVFRAIPAETAQGVAGSYNFTSTDNSVLYNVVGQNINLRAASTGGGGAGQATATNVGDYVDNAINEYIQPGAGSVNLGYIQVGTVSAFTNNPRIINPTTSPATGGYTFFNGAAQANVPSVVAELGPQRQLFRAYMTGQWSLVPQNYSFYRQGVGGGFVLAPVFMRSGGDWQATTSDLFPGFTNTAIGLLAPLTTVTPTPFRGGVSGGPRWTQNVYQVAGISTAFAGSQVNQTAVRITLANSATVSVFRGQEVTVPLKNLLSNDYIATEFLVDVNASNSNTIDLILPTGTPIGTGFDQNLAIFTDRNLYIWTEGFPPLNTTFSSTAIVEVWLEANVWVASTTAQWPNGFALPASNPATQYNLTFTVELPDGCNLTSIMYKMFNEQADNWMAPNAGAQWNNSITVNYSQSGGAAGTVTSVGFSAPASNAFAVTNPTTNAVIGFQNVTTPTTQYLRGDGSWQTAVTSVAMSVPASFTIGGSPITGSGTLALTWSPSGLVPTVNLGTGTANTTSFLRGDQSWQTAVTSVAMTVPASFTISSAITTSGTLALAWSTSGLIPTANMGTGTADNTSFLRGDRTWQVITAPPSPSSTTPAANGTGAVGTSLNYARADHVHPFSLTTTGTSGAATYTVATGVLNIPTPPTQPTYPTGAIVGTTDTQTLTNKTLASPTTINSATINSTTIAGGSITRVQESSTTVTASAGALTIDVATSSIFYVTNLSGATTLTISNVGGALTADGQSLTIIVLSDQTATSAFINAVTITGATTTTIRWLGGVVPTVGSNTPATDQYQVIIRRISSGVYRVFASLSGY